MPGLPLLIDPERNQSEWEAGALIHIHTQTGEGNVRTRPVDTGLTRRVSEKKRGRETVQKDIENGWTRTKQKGNGNRKHQLKHKNKINKYFKALIRATQCDTREM